MRALSVRAPWAGLIAEGKKTLEIRKRRTHLRGELLICQSRGGGAVAVVEILDCRPWTPDDAKASCTETTGPDGGPEDCSGQYVWELRLVRRVSSRVVKGTLSFFNVDEAILREWCPKCEGTQRYCDAHGINADCVCAADCLDCYGK